MPLSHREIAQRSPAELKEAARRKALGDRRPKEDSWVSPHFGDGGWHTQPGALRFDPQDIVPLSDHILVAMDEEKDAAGECAIVKPDIAVNRERGTRFGTVLKVGPGAWKDSRTHKQSDMFKRLPMTLKPGDRVIIGPLSDWESWDADYEGRGANIVLCQEADVRLYHSAFDFVGEMYGCTH